MQRWTLAPVALLLAILGASPEGARASGLERGTLRMPEARELELLVVEGAAGGSGAHTLGWLYYDELVSRGYVDLRDPGDPSDDVLVDADGNGVADFHEDLFNLNPDRPYVGEGSRCLPEQIFFHLLPDARVARFRAPELLTGACANGSDYVPGVGPRRWPVGDWSLPSQPGGAVVGRTLAEEPALLGHLGRPETLADAPFSDRGVFPHVPNLLEPRDPLNGHRGLGHLVAPRAFDGVGRLIPGSDPSLDLGEAGRRLRLGRIDGGREVVFFLVTQGTQLPGMSADACLIPYRGPSGWMECSLWAHGDTQVYFSKTLLNLDLHQLPDERLTTKDLGTEWLSDSGYRRLGSAAYGGIVVGKTVKEVRGQGERSPHALLHTPRSRPEVMLLGWEDSSAGGDRSFNDAVFLIQGLAPATTVITIEADPNPVQENSLVTVTMRVTTSLEGDPITEGEVSLYVDGQFLATLSLSADGTASIMMTLDAGTHILTADYSGSEGTYEPSVADEYFLDVEGPDGGSPDGGRPDAGTADAGMDAGAPDSGSPDGGRPDSGTTDAGVDAGTSDSGTPVDAGTDAGSPDGGGPVDAGTGDAGSPDGGGPVDAGTTDAGTADAGGQDAGSTDAGTADAGGPDSGTSDAGADGGSPGGDAGSSDGGTGSNDGGVTDGGNPGSDAGDTDGGTSVGDAGDEDAGVDGGGNDAGGPDGGEDPDAGDPNASDGGNDAGLEGPELPGIPRDLTVTGWGCAAGGASGLPLWWLGACLGLTLHRWPRRSRG
ncbi:hypothetical protein LZ198_39155 [Myxococcus sp. K15C18031901]|uniref:hypothetical protein n=1 Tax=Myxococcus dinghuensis TaxID=2906761 RepID=UPI0020A76605|nr:hypothetical protein [Myxococcus dinghuensis]MCP3104902.1 hypothetical protein [Myxococcus dinghuensis]